jgi:hypothetical protein
MVKMWFNGTNIKIQYLNVQTNDGQVLRLYPWQQKLSSPAHHVPLPSYLPVPLLLSPSAPMAAHSPTQLHVGFSSLHPTPLSPLPLSLSLSLSLFTTSSSSSRRRRGE